jgi:hypothetical protein
MRDINKTAYIFSIVLIVLCNKTSFSAQTNFNKKSLEVLFNEAQKTNNKTKKIEYLQDFVSLAKKEKKKNKIFAGYYLLASAYNNQTKLTYLDSIINVTKNAPTKNYPSIAYNAKAIYLQNQGLNQKAIDNFLLSNKYAYVGNNETIINLNNFAIASVKRTIEEYEEAKILFKKTLNFSNVKNISSLNTISLISLSNVSYELEEVDSATYYNKLGISKTLKNNDVKNYHHFAVNQGIVHYIKKEYDIALDSLLKHKPYFLKNKDSINLSYIHFYLGKIYQDKGDKELATKYYKKIDSLLNLKLNLTPKFRESYVYLINKFKQENDLKNQLFYIERLLDFDSVVYSKTNYLSKTIFKEYDIPNLKKEKKNIVKKMNDDHALFVKSISIIGALLGIAILFLIYQSYKRKQYKKSF